VRSRASVAEHILTYQNVKYENSNEEAKFLKSGIYNETKCIQLMPCFLSGS